MNSLEEGETILLMLKSSRTEITVGGRLAPKGTSRLIPCHLLGSMHWATMLCRCVGACTWAGARWAAALRRCLAVEMSPSHLGGLFFSLVLAEMCPSFPN